MTKIQIYVFVENNLLSNANSKNKRVSFQTHIGVNCQATAYLFERTGCAAMRCLDIAASIMYKRSVFF